MTPSESRTRTQQFALRVFRLVEAWPKSHAAKTIAMQLARSGASTGANYRAAGQARSKAEFRAKLGIVIEEADESACRPELIIMGNLLGKPKVEPLLQEANEPKAIMVASRRSSEYPARRHES